MHEQEYEEDEEWGMHRTKIDPIIAPHLFSIGLEAEDTDRSSKASCIQASKVAISRPVLRGKDGRVKGRVESRPFM